MIRAPAIALFFLVLQGAAHADDDDVIRRRMQFAEEGGEMVTSTVFRELLRGKESDVKSGLPTSVVLRLYVYREGDDLPVSLRLASVKLVYDLWDEVYLVRTEGPRGQKTTRHQTQKAAIRAATSLERFPIAPLSKLEIGPRYFVAVVAELNPLSPELLAEVRGWLSKPSSERDLGVSSAFFGSFVSIFSNPKLPPAEAVFRARSQMFYRVER